MACRPPLGQHFLVDRAAIARIVDALDVHEGDPVVEIGPGRGALTGPLIEAAGRIAAVELDRNLADALRRRHDPSRLVLVQGNILRIPLADLARALGSAAARPALRVAGNLPYAISKPIADKLVRERRQVERAVLMFQREVAERFTGSPGERSYGPATILAGRAFAIQALFDLAPRAFRPPPRVASRVTRWCRRTDRELTDDEEARLRACLAAGFGQRRRTLRNNLRAALGDDEDAARLLDRAQIDGRLRAEQVDPAGFARLAAAWPARSLV